MSIILKRTLFIIAFIAFWQVIFALGIFPVITLPSPWMVLKELVEGFASGELIWALLSSFKHLAIGMSTSIIIGTALGVLLGKSRHADETVGMYLIAMQSIPSIVWVPLAIMLFGLNEAAVIFVVIIGGTFVMALNVRTAIQNVPQQYKRAARTMGYKNVALFFNVEVPSSVPYFMSGLRLSWAFSWRALMAGELLSNGPGLGYSLRYAMDFAQMELVIGIIIIIGVIGSIVDQLFFYRLEQKVAKRWGLME